jgi:hypothetical protein
LPLFRYAPAGVQTVKSAMLIFLVAWRAPSAASLKRRH